MTLPGDWSTSEGDVLGDLKHLAELLMSETKRAPEQRWVSMSEVRSLAALVPDAKVPLELYGHGEVADVIEWQMSRPVAIPRTMPITVVGIKWGPPSRRKRKRSLVKSGLICRAAFRRMPYGELTAPWWF